MRSRYMAIIMLLGGLGLALTAAGLSYKWIKSKETSQVQPVEKRQEIVVAKQDLAWGTVISADMITTMPFPEMNLPEGYFTDPTTISGRVLTAAVKVKEPILKSKLAPDDVKEGGLAVMVKPGKRVMIIGIKEEAQFINQHNTVDIVLTVRKSGETRTVLQNIAVLAVQKDPTGRQRGGLLALEVTPNEAEKLALVAQEGTLRMALRNPQDRRFVATHGISIADIIGTGQEITPPPVIKIEDIEEPEEEPVEPERPLFEVEIIKGSAISRAAFY